jgi:zinc transport system substrate-binding protein
VNILKSFLNHFKVAIAIFLFFCFCTGCSQNEHNSKRITVSFYPIYVATLNLVKGLNLEAANISGTHSGCLHDFVLQVEDMKKIEKSSVFIINGANMEPFMTKITSEIPKIKIIDSSQGIPLIEDRSSHNHGNKEHEHGKNPHIWLSVKNHIKQVQNISKGLREAFSENSEKICENEKEYIEKLNKLDSDGEAQLKDIKDKNVVTFHSAFDYFASDYGLKVICSVDYEPNVELSAKKIAKTVQKIKDFNVRYLIVETNYSGNSAQAIAKETNAKILFLNPITCGENEPESYLTAMRENFKELASKLN